MNFEVYPPYTFNVYMCLIPHNNSSKISSLAQCVETLNHITSIYRCTWSHDPHGFNIWIVLPFKYTHLGLTMPLESCTFWIKQILLVHLQMCWPPNESSYFSIICVMLAKLILNYCIDTEYGLCRYNKNNFAHYHPYISTFTLV